MIRHAAFAFVSAIPTFGNIIGYKIPELHLDMLEALSALRASWEKEREELVNRAYKWMKLEENSSDKIESLEAEKKGLEEREHIAGCYEVYGDCTCKDLHERVVEEMKQESLRHLKYLSDANIENANLKAENESNYKKASDFQMELAKSVPIAFAKEQEAKIDTMTHALAEAREILQKNSDEWHDFNKIEPGHSCEAKIRLHAISQRSTLGLSNPTSLRASEEMKGLRKVVEAARLSNKECRKWRSNPDEKPCHEFKSLVDNDLLCHGCRLMNRIEALEAYESRGKV